MKTGSIIAKLTTFCAIILNILIQEDNKPIKTNFC